MIITFMSKKRKGPKWTQPFAPEISGDVPKIAAELVRLIKRDPKTELEIEVVEDNKKLPYSVAIDYASNKISLGKFSSYCEIKDHIFTRPYDCNRCSRLTYKRVCFSDIYLRKLAEYLKSYSKYNVEVLNKAINNFGQT